MAQRRVAGVYLPGDNTRLDAQALRIRNLVLLEYINDTFPTKQRNIKAVGNKLEIMMTHNQSYSRHNRSYSPLVATRHSR